MTDFWITMVGLTAATCTTVSLVPQVCRVRRSKQTRDISLLMYTILSTGLFLWLLYGLLTRDLPLILANVISVSLSFWVLLLKLKHG